MEQLSLMEEGQILVNEGDKVAFNINQDDIYVSNVLLHLYLLPIYAMTYCKCIIYSVYNIWRLLKVLLFSMDLICRFIFIYLFKHI